MKNVLFCLLTLFLNWALTAQSENDIYTIVAPSGLSLRSAPYVSAERLAVVPFNQQVISQQNHDEDVISDTIGGVAGQWWRMRYGNLEGFLFSPYLKYGHLFTPEKDVADNFKILIPGTRLNSLNYNPSFHWYALQRGAPSEPDSPYQLLEVKPEVLVGPIVVEQFDGMGGYLSSDLTEVDPQTMGQDVVILIGARHPVKQLKGSSYFTPTNRYSKEGRLMYPYQTLELFRPAGEERPYYLYAEQKLVMLNNEKYQHFELGITRYDYFNGYNTRNCQALSAELLPYDSEDTTVHLGQFTDQARLLWQGDLNGDGAPELLFFKPNTSQSCGGTEYFILLESKWTGEGFRWEKASSDEIVPWEGC